MACKNGIMWVSAKRIIGPAAISVVVLYDIYCSGSSIVNNRFVNNITQLALADALRALTNSYGVRLIQEKSEQSTGG